MFFLSEIWLPVTWAHYYVSYTLRWSRTDSTLLSMTEDPKPRSVACCQSVSWAAPRHKDRPPGALLHALIPAQTVCTCICAPACLCEHRTTICACAWVHAPLHKCCATVCACMSARSFSHVHKSGGCPAFSSQSAGWKRLGGPALDSQREYALIRNRWHIPRSRSIELVSWVHFSTAVSPETFVHGRRGSWMCSIRAVSNAFLASSGRTKFQIE